MPYSLSEPRRHDVHALRLFQSISAEHHKADIRVSVNNDPFEFYSAETPTGSAQLDREGAETVRRDIAVSKNENAQGGI